MLARHRPAPLRPRPRDLSYSDAMKLHPFPTRLTLAGVLAVSLNVVAQSRDNPQYFKRVWRRRGHAGSFG